MCLIECKECGLMMESLVQKCPLCDLKFDMIFCKKKITELEVEVAILKQKELIEQQVKPNTYEHPTIALSYMEQMQNQGIEVITPGFAIGVPTWIDEEHFAQKTAILPNETRYLGQDEEKHWVCHNCDLLEDGCKAVTTGEDKAFSSVYCKPKWKRSD